jgi:recombination protein RecR
MQIPSQYLEQVVDQLASLPGIGRRTALRLALDLLKRSEVELSDFISALTALQDKVLHCRRCGNIADTQICQICNNSRRDSSLICVVEDIRDVMAIESTNTYNGLYHVLGGLISPMDGVGPQQLNIVNLTERVQNEAPKEVILALSPTMEGDTTNFYIYKKIKEYPLLITRISRGIAVGSEIQYADELTLGRSLQQRQLFDLAQ